MPAIDQILQEYEADSRTLASIVQYFHSALQDPQYEAAWEYVTHTRKLSSEIIDAFTIGYIPPIDYTSRKLREFDVSEQSFKRLGLPSLALLCDRICFPLTDMVGSVVGISARAWRDPSIGGKYVNSRTSHLYKKSLFVQGFPQAIPLISSHGYCILEEGTIDVIQSIQHGFPAVAAGGVAMRKEHLLIVSRFTDTVIGWFDSDAAGSLAFERVGSLCSSMNMKFCPLRITSAKDPDEYLRRYGPTEIAAKIREILQ